MLFQIRLSTEISVRKSHVSENQMKGKREPWIHLEGECSRLKEWPGQKHCGRNELSMLQRAQHDWGAIYTGKSGQMSRRKVIRGPVTSWSILRSLSSFICVYLASDEIESLQDQWSRVVRVRTMVLRIRSGCQPNSPLHSALERLLISLSLNFLIYEMNIVIVPISLDFYED